MKKVLVAPLDWGLGHATRCIPIIRELLKRHCIVSIAGSGESLQLLKKEFPALTFFEIEPYAPVYPKTRFGMAWKMASQLPKFLSAIKKEHKQIEELVSLHDFQLIIADNRYGCWSEKIPSIFITHQSNILMPKRFGWLAGLVKVLNSRFISRFQQCWIPDFPDGNNLTGQLNTLQNSKKGKYKFIGPLSRFEASKRKI
jgi:UDP:flavonoid glycosyltransferase YjiC (YdhE family)